MWRIIATHTREGREIARKEIDVGEVTIGRDADRGLVLQSASVSRRHCKIRVDHTGATITDEGSANGVLVNGVRINPNTPAPIGPGVNVEIAEFRITVEPMMMQQQPMMGMPGMAPISIDIVYSYSPAFILSLKLRLCAEAVAETTSVTASMRIFFMEIFPG